jgi:isoleucyl-tRNA synthetase
MQPTYEANVLERFADLISKNTISRGERPVFWSVD